MPTAHLYLFVDASPSDWLTDGHDDDWHSIAWFAFQLDPNLQSLVDQDIHFQEILNRDVYFQDFFQKFYNGLSRPCLSKWGKSELNYRREFFEAISRFAPPIKPLINGYSFQEKILRTSKNVLLSEFTGGIVDSPVQFNEYVDSNNRKYLRFSFVGFNGFCNIKGRENQTLPLLLMAWGIRNQYRFYWKDIVDSKKYGFDNLAMTVVSDTLSGDDTQRRNWEAFLQKLVYQIPEARITLTRSPVSDEYPADLFVDNFAGWLNASIKDLTGDDAKRLLSLPSLDMFTGWYELQLPDERLKGTPAINRIREAIKLD